MKITIIGTGAVGGYFGAKLVQAGFDVSFLARGKQLEAIRNHGIKIKSILGDFEVTDVKVTDNINDLGLSDLVILAVKAWQIKEVHHGLPQIIHSESLVLPLQNGVPAARELGDVIDEDQVLGGVCRIISKVESPGVINHFGATPTILFGAFSGKQSDHVKQVKSAFDQAGIKSNIPENIRLEIWKKFAFICVGGLMAVTRSTLGEIRELPETRDLLTELIREICQLAGVIGIVMGSDYLEHTLSYIDSLPPETTFSMAWDIWAGRPSELDYINGAVLQLGLKYLVDTPVNRFIYGTLKPMALRT
jgi:2-dehydropantoate 2-reductase